YYNPSFATEELEFHGLEENSEGKTLYFPVRSRKVLVENGIDAEEYFKYIPERSVLESTEVIYIGTLGDIPCHCFEIPEEAEFEDMEFLGLNDLYGIIDEEMLGITSRAVQMADFYRTHQYCGLCASPTHYVPEETGMQCGNCAHIAYPRISPAVVVLIEKEEELLMARSHHFKEGMYGLVAGFVEAGETIEHAVHREVKEEVGVSIKELSYFGSQPWPFPSSLMIGFTATYESGDIEIDTNEIEDAKWFPIDEIPTPPSKKSITGSLIEVFIEKHGPK
ncbi:MAG: NAD(+) diphosphatase, partial [Methanococcoides sp.]|nr:NAD(+) diphosphatase [Methanococcoides sp.]